MNAGNCCGGKPCCSFSFWQDPRVHYSHFWPSVLFKRQESARNASCTLKGSNMSQDWVSRRYTHMNPGSNYGVRIWLVITTYVGGIAGSLEEWGDIYHDWVSVRAKICHVNGSLVYHSHDAKHITRVMGDSEKCRGRKRVVEKRHTQMGVEGAEIVTRVCWHRRFTDEFGLESDSPYQQQDPMVKEDVSGIAEMEQNMECMYVWVAQRIVVRSCHWYAWRTG